MQSHQPTLDQSHVGRTEADGTLPSTEPLQLQNLNRLLDRAARFDQDNPKLYLLKDTEENRRCKPRYFALNDSIADEIRKATPDQIDNVVSSVIVSKVHYEVLRKAVAALAGRERRETMDRWIARLQKPDGTLKGLFLVHRNLLDEDRSDDLFAKHIQSRNINYYQMWAQMGAPLGRERLQGIADGRNPRYPDVRQAAEKMLAAL